MRQPIFFSFLLSCLFACLFLKRAAAQSRYYVDADATGWQTGMNWEDAFRDLHDAFGVAVRGDQIWVAEGTYYPSAADDRTEAFEMYGGIELYGGFAGTESELEQRDPEAHPTILSGDIGIPDYKWDNSFNLLKVYESDTATVIDGLIFRAAYMGEDEGPCYEIGENIGFWTRHNANAYCGGALYVEAASPETAGGLILRHCRFENNSALSGAGMNLLTFADARSIKIEDCSFIGNEHTFDSWLWQTQIPGGEGGGASIAGGIADDGYVSVKNSVFLSNYASLTGAGLYCGSAGVGRNGDGGLFHMSLTIDSSQFVGNAAEILGGGVYVLSYKDSEVRISGSRFSSNTVGMGFWAYEMSDGFEGAAIYVSFTTSGAPYYPEGSFLLENSVLSNNVAHVAPGLVLSSVKESLVRNNLFLQNEALLFAAIANTYGYSHATYRNNTFVKNIAPYYAGLFVSDFGKLNHAFLNNVFWANESEEGTPLFRLTYDTLSLANNIFSDADACNELASLFQSELLCDSSNSLGIDPGFVDASGNDYRPSYCSPLIDGGIVAGIEAGELDLDGHPRVVNLPDIGAYESTDYSPLVESEGINCYGNGNGSIEVVPADFGPPPYTFLWNTGDTVTILEDLGPGIYEVTITDANGCMQYVQVEIEEPLPVEGVYSVVPASAPDASDGAILQDSIGGGTPPYHYFWDTGSEAPSLEGVSPGTYVLTILDDHGCWQELDFEVSFVSALEEWESGGESFLLYPNPSAGESYLLWEEDLLQGENWKLVLYDLSGRSVFEQEIQSGMGYAHLSLAHLPKGSYVYKMYQNSSVLAQGSLLLF